MFFGHSSGIRHSVGGNDYGSVRTGAFMGLRMLSEEARRLQRLGSEAPRLHPRRLSSIAESPTPLGELANMVAAHRQVIEVLPFCHMCYKVQSV